MRNGVATCDRNMVGSGLATPMRNLSRTMNSMPSLPAYRKHNMAQMQSDFGGNVLRCPTCGTENLEGAQICHSCGMIMTPVQPYQAAPAQQPVAPTKRMSLPMIIAILVAVAVVLGVVGALLWKPWSHADMEVDLDFSVDQTGATTFEVTVLGDVSNVGDRSGRATLSLVLEDDRGLHAVDGFNTR